MVISMNKNGDKPELFDILNSISNKQKHYSKDELDNYNPFMIARFLSMGDDTIFFAHEVSKMSSLPNQLQYEFLYKGINKKKRYFKYIKGEKKEKSLGNICKYYNVREEVGLEYLEILTNTQIKEINSLYEEKKMKG